MSDLQEPNDARRALSRSRFAGELGKFPGLVLSGAQALENAGRWNAAFQERIGPIFNGRIIFEIGCFDAEFLCRIAPRHPQAAFVGLDWKARAILDGAGRVQETGLKNVILIRGRGQEIRRIFADREVDEIWVLHPDPFAEAKERANRLISKRFLSDARAVLRNTSSRLILKTDHANYFESAVAMLKSPEVAEQWQVMARSTDFWNDLEMLAKMQSRVLSGEKTLFEARFFRKKLPIFFLEIGRR